MISAPLGPGFPSAISPDSSDVCPAADAPSGAAHSQGDEADVRSQVWRLLGALYPHGEIVERRRERRYPYPYLVRLTPVGDDGVTPEGESVVVVGKHLSERGLGFYHPKPLPHRRMIASFDAAVGPRMSLLIDLSWCRFTRQGWYESGGRFLHAVTPSRT